MTPPLLSVFPDDSITVILVVVSAVLSTVCRCMGERERREGVRGKGNESGEGGG